MQRPSTDPRTSEKSRNPSGPSLDPSDLSEEEFSLLREFERRQRESPSEIHLLATTVPAIRPFHLSHAEFRLLRGPNGGGKSVSGAAELVSVAKGFHPLRNERFETPNVTWAVCLDYKNAGRVMKRRLVDMLPRDRNGEPLWKYYKQDSLFVLKRPWLSEIYLKQQAEGPTSLYAERCTAIWIDEIKPGAMGEDNFSELISRYAPGKRLQIFMTATPEWGADWARRRFDDSSAVEHIKGSEVFEFSLYDCLIDRGGFLTLEEVRRQAALCSDEHRAARIFGRWGNFAASPYFSGGRILKTMERSRERPGRRMSAHAQGSRFVLADDPDGKVLVRREVEEGHEYITSWDPGAGKRRDAHGLVVLDRSDAAIAAFVRCDDMDPVWFAAQIVVPLASAYNDSLLVHESNGDLGGAATEALRESYSNLYRRRTYQKSTAIVTDEIGWRTTGSQGHTGGTRGIMLASLDRALREGVWDPPVEVLDEMSHMVRKPDGKVEHEDGCHDDLAIACSIALSVHYEDPPIKLPPMTRMLARYRSEDFAAHAL